MKLRWSKIAAEDLEHVRAWVAQQRPGAANSAAARIYETTRRVAKFPNSGRAGRKPGTREAPVAGTPWIVVYRIKDGNVELMQIVDGRRDFPETD